MLVDKDVNVKRSAVSVLCFVFPSAPNKIETWNELHRLVYNDDNEVRQITAKVIGSVFQHIPVKNEAWEDLHNLALDDDVNVKDQLPPLLDLYFLMHQNKSKFGQI